MARKFNVKLFRFLLIFLGFAWIIFACPGTQADIINTPEPQSPATAVTTPTPDWFDANWFDMKLTDAQTGETFTMNDYAGKVVWLKL
jgi:hypothetical protein